MGVVVGVGEGAAGMVQVGEGVNVRVGSGVGVKVIGTGKLESRAVIEMLAG